MGLDGEKVLFSLIWIETVIPRVRQLVLTSNPTCCNLSFNMTFGEKLRQVRRDAGFTQRELAESAGLDFSYISKVENDRNSPPAADTIVRICNVMKVPPESLLALTGKIPSDVTETISANVAAQEFLRETHRLALTENEWRELSRTVRRLRKEGR